MGIFVVQGAIVGRDRHARGRAARPAGRLQHRRHRAGARAAVARQLPAGEHLPDQPHAERSAAGRHRADRARSRWCWPSSPRSTRAGAPAASTRPRRCAMSELGAAAATRPAQALHRRAASTSTVLHGVDLARARGRNPGHRRRLGFGQEHAAAPAGRPGCADRRQGAADGPRLRDHGRRRPRAAGATSTWASSTSSTTCCPSSARSTTWRCRCASAARAWRRHATRGGGAGARRPALRACSTGRANSRAASASAWRSPARW